MKAPNFKAIDPSDESALTQQYSIVNLGSCSALCVLPVHYVMSIVAEPPCELRDLP